MEVFELWTANYWLWFGLAVVLLVLEAFFGGFMFLATSVAALAVGIVTHYFPYLGLVMQLLIFVMLASGTLMVARSWVVTRQEKIRVLQNSALNQHYMGREFALMHPINNGRSSLNIDGIVWQLHGEDAPAGTKMAVVAVGDGFLEVKKVNS